MDPELKAYLDERFRENAEQISAVREETAAFRKETAQRFEQIDQRFEQIDQRFERVEETARQTLVLVEDLRGNVSLIAEGFAGLTEKVARLQEEIAQIFDRVKAWMEPYFRNLDRRIRALEARAERPRGDLL